LTDRDRDADANLETGQHRRRDQIGDIAQPQRRRPGDDQEDAAVERQRRRCLLWIPASEIAAQVTAAIEEVMLTQSGRNVPAKSHAAVGYRSPLTGKTAIAAYAMAWGIAAAAVVKPALKSGRSHAICNCAGTMSAVRNSRAVHPRSRMLRDASIIDPRRVLSRGPDY
jgi:hypothetical protein